MVWLVLHYWPDRDAFSRQFAAFWGKSHGIRIVTLGIKSVLLDEFHRYLSWFWKAKLHRHLFEGLVVAGCGVWMAMTGGRKERTLIIVWLAMFVIATLLMANPFGWYLIYVWPLFALWMARTFVAAYGTLWRRFALVTMMILMAGYMFNLALWAGKAFSGPSYSEISDELRAIVQKRDSVVAGGEWWFVFYDRDFTDATHIQLSALVAGQSPAPDSYGWGRAWSDLGWNVVVAHGDEQLMLDTQVPMEKAMALMSVSRRDRRDEILEARAFATEKGRSLHRIQTATTPILVLRLDPRR